MIKKCKLCDVLPKQIIGDFLTYSVVFCVKCDNTTKEYWHHECDENPELSLAYAVDEWNNINSEIFSQDKDKLIEYVKALCKPVVDKFKVTHPDDFEFESTPLEREVLKLAVRFDLC